ncbi:MAG: SPASM domain-containing protein [Nitrosopumilales archaeon]|nr:SPASM domain-containing protein [Nitrosopumilales archaeon]
MTYMAFLPVQKNDKYQSETINYKEFHKKVEGLNDLAIKMGYRVSPGYKLPGSTFCGAYDDQYFLLDARGDVHKCVVMTGQHEFRLGYLADDGSIVLNSAAPFKWDFDPFKDAECSSCEFLPACMGGCQNMSVKNKQGSGRCSIKDNHSLPVFD